MGSEEKQNENMQGNVNPQQIYGMPPVQGNVSPQQAYGMPPVQGGMNPQQAYGMPPVQGGVNPQQAYGMPPMQWNVNPQQAYGMPPVQGGVNPQQIYGMPPVQGNVSPQQANAAPPMQGNVPPQMGGYQAGAAGSYIQMPQYNRQEGSYMSYQNSRAAAKPVKEKKNIEGAIGKNIMGILASFLIFLGLILVVRATYESLSDVVRVILMYTISFALFGAGMVGKRKNPNPFFLSLTGCGVGAVYISLFITYSYFGMIGMIVLYVLLAAWSVVVYFIGGKNSNLFRIIGQLGLVVSVIYGVVCINRDSAPLVETVYAVSIFHIGVSCFYMLMEKNKGAAVNLPSLIINMLGASGLVMAVYKINDMTTGDLSALINGGASVVTVLFTSVLLSVLILAYILFLLFLYVKRIINEKNLSASSVGWIFYSLHAMILGAFFIDNRLMEGMEWLSGLFVLVFYCAILVMNELRAKEAVTRVIDAVLVFPFLALGCLYMGTFSEIVGCAVLVLPFGLLGYFRKSKLYSIMAMVSTLVFLVSGSEYLAVYLLLGLVLLCFLMLLMILNRQKTGIAEKYIWYTVMQVYIIASAEKVIDIGNTTLTSVTVYSFAFAASVLLCLAATFSKFSNDWKETEKIQAPMRIMLGMVNALLMILGCCLIFFHVSKAVHAMDVAFLFIAFVMNIAPMVKYYSQNAFCGFYMGIKLTVFLICALASYDAEGYIISLCCLIMAISCIVFGFIAKYKYIRFYGLLLAIFSIAKMVLFDFKFDDKLGRALSVMGCGIIAFAISFVYSVIDKKSSDSLFGREKASAKAGKGAAVQNGTAQAGAYGSMAAAGGGYAPMYGYGNPQMYGNGAGNAFMQGNTQGYGNGYAPVNPYGNAPFTGYQMPVDGYANGAASGNGYAPVNSYANVPEQENPYAPGNGDGNVPAENGTKESGMQEDAGAAGESVSQEKPAGTEEAAKKEET